MVDETKSAKMPRVWISKLVINDGSEIELSRNDTVIFVGPKNAGKKRSAEGNTPATSAR